MLYDLGKRLEAAGAAIHAHERNLTDAMLNGTGNLKGLADMPEVQIIGGIDNPRREGLVACRVEGRDTAEVVTALNERGIRTHIRKADYYSANILDPLGLSDCIRVSMCHYNTIDEVSAFLTAMREIIEDDG
jgi:selenocysteine lyase/cysteine desulfurase